jgi:hypothetical protein
MTLLTLACAAHWLLGGEWASPRSDSWWWSVLRPRSGPALAVIGIRSRPRRLRTALLLTILPALAAIAGVGLCLAYIVMFVFT